MLSLQLNITITQFTIMCTKSYECDSFSVGKIHQYHIVSYTVHFSFKLKLRHDEGFTSTYIFCIMSRFWAYLLTSSADSAMKKPCVAFSILILGPGLMASVLSRPSSWRTSIAISSNFSLLKHSLQTQCNHRSKIECTIILHKSESITKKGYKRKVNKCSQLNSYPSHIITEPRKSIFRTFSEITLP